MNILVIRISTNDMQGVIFNESSDIRYQTEADYQPQQLGEGNVEQNPLEWSAALMEVCRDCMQFLEWNQESLEAIVYTSQRSSVIPVDENGKPLRNAIMWSDTRNASYISSLIPKAARIYELSGSTPNAVFSGTKMRWIMEHQPEIYAQTYKFCTVGDYLNYVMTGEFKTDYTYGSRSMLMNIGRFEWDEELLELIGVERDKLCEIVPPGSITGFTTESFSKSSGIPTGIPVISAGGDQQCSALGAGVLEENSTEITVGPGGYIFSCSGQKLTDVSRGIMCSAHAIPEKYVLECSMINSDDIYRWVNYLFFGGDDMHPKNFVKIDRAVDETPVGSHGCIAIPYLSGRGTPDWNMQAFGGFLNVSLATTKGDMSRSVLESIACEMSNMLEVLGSCTTVPDEIFLGGYLVHSRAFCQMIADASGIVMKRNLTPIAQTSFGAFIVASVTLGIYGRYEDSFARGRQHIRYKTFEPIAENHKVYSELRGRINDLYRRLVDPVYRQ